MFDLHCHSEFSMDSRESMENSVRVGIERNLKSICFTDHIDFFPEDPTKNYAFVPRDYFVLSIAFAIHTPTKSKSWQVVKSEWCEALRMNTMPTSEIIRSIMFSCHSIHS